MDMIAQIGWWPLLAWLIILVCGALMLVILVQKGRGGGLSAAFGGGGGGGSAFGTKTGDVFTWITVALAAIFALITVVANYAFYIDRPEDGTARVVAAAPGGETESVATDESTPMDADGSIVVDESVTDNEPAKEEPAGDSNTEKTEETAAKTPAQEDEESTAGDPVKSSQVPTGTDQPETTAGSVSNPGDE